MSRVDKLWESPAPADDPNVRTGPQGRASSPGCGSPLTSVDSRLGKSKTSGPRRHVGDGDFRTLGQVTSAGVKARTTQTSHVREVR